MYFVSIDDRLAIHDRVIPWLTDAAMRSRTSTLARDPAALIRTGSVVAPGTIVPPATLYAGSPAVRVRALSDEELSSSAAAVAELGRLSLEHATAGVPPDVAAALGVPASTASKTAIA